MAQEVFANRASTTVTSGGTDAPISGTQETWTVSSSATFPAITSGVTQFHVQDQGAPSEIILVTAVSGTSWTVIRGAESTTPVAHAPNFGVYQTLTAGTLGNLVQPGTTPSFTSVTVTGGTGATAGQVLGGATASGPPMSGTWTTGATVTDQAGQIWVCRAGGTPGSWITAALMAAQALTPLRAGLANRAYAQCSIVCLGDSITVGQGASVMDNRWVGCLRRGINSRYPTPNQPAGGRGIIACTGTGESSFTYPVVTNGSPAKVNNGVRGGDGAASGAFQLNTSGQSFVFSLNGDSASIMWDQVGFGGTFSYQVDSGGTTNQSTNGSSSHDGQLTHISLGSAGAHTVTLAWVSGNATVDGVIEYYGDYTSGIQTHDCGHYGWQAGNWVTSLNGGVQSGPTAAIAALAPCCVIIYLGVNDQTAGVNPATFGTNLQTIISDLKVQLASPLPSFILLMGPPRGGQSGYPYAWALYAAQAWAVAAADTSGPGGTSLVSVIDFTQGPLLPGPDTDVTGLWAGDNVHPDNKGHQAIADRILDFICAAG